MTDTAATPICFVDCETTGLDPDRHEVWEVALIVRTDRSVTGVNFGEVADVEYTWELPVDLGRAESIALEVGGFYRRAKQAVNDVRRPFTDDPSIAEFARQFARLTHGAHLVGAVPSFDATFLAKMLRRNGACPGWHYHLVDVEALAIGYLRGLAHGIAVAGDVTRYPRAIDVARNIAPPWKSDELTAALGIDGTQFEKHTAMGDARWARAIYDLVMRGSHETWKHNPPIAEAVTA